VPNDKGASDNILTPPLSDLQTQLSKHETYHARVKAINSALRSAGIKTSDPDAEQRVREVLLTVLGEEQLVAMYERQLWKFSRGQRSPKFPTEVLVKNGRAINAIRKRLEEVSR
jgi:hypothetical protein